MASGNSDHRVAAGTSRHQSQPPSAPHVMLRHRSTTAEGCRSTQNTVDVTSPREENATHPSPPGSRRSSRHRTNTAATAPPPPPATAEAADHGPRRPQHAQPVLQPARSGRSCASRHHLLAGRAPPQRSPPRRRQDLGPITTKHYRRVATQRPGPAASAHANPSSARGREGPAAAGGRASPGRAF